MAKLKMFTLVAGLSGAVLLLGAGSLKVKLAFEKALVLEEVEARAQDAVILFQEVVANASDKSLAAQAQLHIGICYEKLGKPEAGEAYQRVLGEYAEQREAVRLAREGLARLGESKRAKRDEQAGVSLKEIKLDASELGFALSPDGTKVAYTDRTQNLAIRDLRAGKDRRVTNFKKDKGAPGSPVWSPDGKRVAYMHFYNYWKYEMEIVSLETGEVRHTEVNGYPADWTKDGLYILYTEGWIDKASPTVNLLPVKGGPSKRLNVNPNETLRFSPDGGHIVYVSKEEDNQDIYVMPVEGGEPIRITSDSAADVSPLWSPDGKFILFKSNRVLDRWALWAAPFKDGKLFGQPFVVRPDVGDARLHSWSEDGKLLFSSSQSVSDFYVVNVDVEGRRKGEVIKLTRGSEAHSPPAWSPDGKQIAYFSGRRGETISILCVTSADGKEEREEREIASIAPYKGPIDWLNDDEIVLIADIPEKREKGIYSVSVSSREIKPILVDNEVMGHVDVSPDGKRIAFLRGLQHHQIYSVDVDGSNLRQITSDDKASVYNPAWSPDGRQLVFSKSARGRRGISILSLNSGEERELLGSDDPEARFRSPSWSPDGSKIIYSSRNADSQNAIWIVPTSGEIKPQRVQVDIPSLSLPSIVESEGGLFSPRWSPDGTKAAFVAGTWSWQLWIMEDFLPQGLLAQK